MPLVSVIVPVYNVERYIERCARCLFSQTFNDVEFVFINDATPDRSLEILSRVVLEFPNKKNAIRIINHDKNLGLAAARTTGIKAATGVYQIHIDSDDWVEIDMIEQMYNKAIQSNADIVVCDFFHEYSSNQKIEHIKEIHDFDKDAMVANGMYWWNVWARLVKSSLYKDNNIYPLPGINATEDVNTMMRLYWYAKKIEYVHEPLYHYNRQNENSLMHGENYRMLFGHLSSLLYLKDFFNGKSDNIVMLLNISISCLRDQFLLKPRNWKLWRKTVPEITEYVVNDKSLSKIYRLCYSMANKGIIVPFKFYLYLSSLKK